MSSKVVRVRCLGVGGTTTVNLDRCREFSIGPPIIPGELPVDRSQYGIYYLTPDLRWVAECHISPDRVYYQETTRNAVRNRAFRVGHYPLPRELQTEHYSDKEKTPPPSLRPSRPGVPMVTFNLDPEEIRQFRGVSHGTVKSVDEEMTAGPPPRENEPPAAVDASRRHHHHHRRRRRRLRRMKDESPAAVTPSGTVTPETASPRPPHREEKPGAAPAWGTEAKPSSNTKQKRRRAPRQISKVQLAIAILKHRAKNARESIRLDDIAKEAGCTPQNLYKSPDFQSEWRSVRARRIKLGWKIEGVADCLDESTLDVG
jgi:hypothetical protein